MYSQNDEEFYILNHFNGQTGSFLDIGAYDGKDLSNTRALMERGWSGVCIEPHPKTFEKLAQNCMEFKNVHCYELAIGEVNGTFKLNANDTYYSTLKDSELDRWKGQFNFEPVECEVIDFKTLMKTCPIRTFDFISIDAEGVDFEILSQIDLNEVGCSMVCVETNGKDVAKYIDYIKSFKGFAVITVNAENLIMSR